MEVIRRRTLLGAMGGIALGLAGCGKKSGGKGNGKGTVVFRIWDETQLPGYRKSVAEFHRRNPDITVTVEQLPYAQYWSKLVSEVAAGKGPDIFWNTVSYFPELVTRGVLVPMDDLMKRDSVDLSVYFPQVTDSYRYKGKLYGMPADFGITGMVYN